MLETLFEAIDKEILTPELKSDLESSFNEAVETKAKEQAEVLLEAEKSRLEEAANEYAEKIIAEKSAELAESVESYLDRVTSEFIAESKASMNESIANSNAELIIEAFQAAMISAGVSIAKIEEAKDESMVESALEDKTAKYDAAIEEILEKSKQIEELTKTGIILEMCEGLSLVESDKFKKLADQISYEKNDSYLAKLEVIKESVKGSKEEISKPIVESVKDSEPSWKRFV